MRLLLLFTIAIMTITLFADEVKPADKLPDTTKQVEKEVKGDKEKQPDITIIPGDGMNLAVEDMINPYYVVVKLNSPAHNWFAGQFKNLPTDKETAIGLSMDDNDTTGNKADVSKWKGLMPVMTYGDPTKYETYEWYTKDEKGRWVSGDPFKKGDDKYAGAGKVPTQTAISKEVAEDFLSKDGKYWQPWREVDGAEALPNLNIFRIKQKFKFNTATVCMRVPYTYTYQQEFIKRLKEAKIPGVFVDEIGETKGKRKLQVIRIDDRNINTQLFIENKRVTIDSPEEVTYRIENNKNTEVKPRVILITAQEHATEHSSSWTAIGSLLSFLKNIQDVENVRKSTIWMFINIYDPDGNKISSFDSLTDQFMPHQNTYIDSTPIEIISYGRYLRAFVNNGCILECVTNFHNVECNENSNVSLPFSIRRELNVSKIFSSLWFEKLTTQGFITDKPEPSKIGRIDNRLIGWANNSFNSIPFTFEVNDRYPLHKLNLSELQNIGESYPSVLVNFLDSKIGVDRVKITHTFLEKRAKDLLEHWKTNPWAQDCPTIFELLALGY